ncbi:hypothetical protein THRCLA_02554 [Thraustotheca clavata]|uniref:PX domain-containing protein n=1 Tax=Thraustotheca clavata TaxID=74557 RepID=A0A1W0A510_9STRA|nr:hypothetical protein THRCLA_02554 [Thraustotheca clavata]
MVHATAYKACSYSTMPLVVNTIDVNATITHIHKSATTGLGSYAEYVIRVVDHDGVQSFTWTLHRRYSEFRALRDALLQVPLCPSCTALIQRNTMIQPFPRRHWFTSKTARVLEERRVLLALFLNTMTKVVHQCSAANCPTRTLMESFLELRQEKYPVEDPDVMPMLQDELSPPSLPAPKPRKFASKRQLSLNFQTYRSAIESRESQPRAASLVLPISNVRPKRKKLELTLDTIEESEPYLSTCIPD